VILSWQDHDGDSVAVLASAIVGLSVGTINGPRTPGADVTVTLIWAAGAAQPFMVAAPFAEVLGAWSEARLAEAGARDTAAQAAYPGVYPLVAHQYPDLIHPSNLLPDPKAAWAAKPTKEIEP